MTSAPHPDRALFPGEQRFPVVAPCDHYAGSEKLIVKALALQAQNPTFDVTLDCEDGAEAGREAEHAEMVATLLAGPQNVVGRAGVRVHDPQHPAWRQDVDVVLAAAGARVAHITLPKATSVEQVRAMIAYVRQACARHGVTRALPIHVLIETHGALRDAWAIAALPWVRGLDFGLMDFVSGHHGALPSACMRSPGQFEHAAVRRAKAEVVAAALAHGRVPVHNVTLDLKDPARTFDDARRARDEFGFLRMWSIHPVQIEPIVRALAPSFDETLAACAVLLRAQAASWGPVAHEGELYDRASYRYHWALVQRARLSGQRLPEEVERVFFAHATSGAGAPVA